MKKTKLQKVISLVLALTLMLSAFVINTFIPVYAQGVWDGTLSEPTARDSDGNILISNGSQLAWVIKNGGGADKFYKLTSDIYLNDITKINWATGEVQSGYTPNKWYSHSETFEGTIDGDGHVIYGLYNDLTPAASGPYGSALIPSITKYGTAMIVNLGIDKAYVRHHNASAFVAVAENATLFMDSCYAGQNVTLTGLTVGAFRAYAKNAPGGSIANCYSAATLNGTTQSGLIGLFWDAADSLIIKNCYNANGPLSTHAASGQAASSNNYASTSSSFTEGVTVVSADNMKGTDVFTNSAKMSNLNLQNKYVATDNNPVLKVFTDVADSEYITIWNGLHTTAPVDSDNDGVYEITNGEELAYVIYNGGGNSYKLTNDIYLNDITKINWLTGEVQSGYTANIWFDEWGNNKPAANFSGTIDGNGFVIYGMYLDNAPTSYVAYHQGTALIPAVAQNATATILNLGIDCAYLHHANTASAFVAAALQGSVVNIDGCYVGAKVTLKAGAAAAFRGFAYKAHGGSITNSYSVAKTVGTSFNGLVGQIYDDGYQLVINNCYNANGPISTHNHAALVTSSNNYESYHAFENVLAEGVTRIESSKMQGADVFTNTDKMSGISPLKYVAVADNYPELKSFYKLSTVKNSNTYIGRNKDGTVSYYSNTVDSADYFWRYDGVRVDNNDTMDLQDLIYMITKYNNGEDTADLDFDGATTTSDIEILRSALLGNADYASKPKYYTPFTTLNGNYQFVWGDEFTGDTLNLDKWTASYTKMGGRDVLIVENTPQTISVGDGALKLTAYKDSEGNYHVPNSVHTKGTMNYKYGYVEIRAKLSLELGSFASFWTRSVSDTGNPQSLAPANLNHYAEVDMFEVFQNGGNQCVGGNILKNFPGQADKNWYATPMNWTQQTILTDEEYHVYGYEWTPTEINLYYDGVKYARFDITESWTENTTAGKGLDGWVKDVTRFTDKSGTGMECFNEAQYLIFNHHLHHEDGFTASTSVTENTNFVNADYIIDYCRVFQLEGQEIYTN